MSDNSYVAAMGNKSVVMYTHDSIKSQFDYDEIVGHRGLRAANDHSHSGKGGLKKIIVPMGVVLALLGLLMII